MADSLFWGRCVIIPSPLIPATFLHFAQFLLNKHGRKESILRWLFYIVALGFSSISLSDLIFTSSTWRPNLNCYYTEPGPMYIFYTLFFFGTVLFTLWLMWDGYRNAQGVKKTQIGWVLGAYAFGYLGGSTTFLPIYHLPMPDILFIYDTYRSHSVNLRDI